MQLKRGLTPRSGRKKQLHHGGESRAANRDSSTVPWTGRSGDGGFSWKIFQSPSCSPEAGDWGLSRVLKIICDKPRPSGRGPAPLLPLDTDWPKAVNQILNDEGTEAGKGGNGSAKMKPIRIYHRCYVMKRRAERRKSSPLEF